MQLTRKVLGTRFFIAATLALGIAGWTSAMAANAQDSSVVTLNNDGVRALTKRDYVAAIEKFERALKLDGTYKLARSNLAIAYNNFGLDWRSKPDEALKLFHKALMLDPTNSTTKQNVDGMIRMMGLNPESFEDRVKLGDNAQKAKDYSGAIIEYSAALELKDSATVHEKLGDIYCIVDRRNKAIEQFEAALALLKYNFQLEQKLRLLRSVGGVPANIKKAADDRDPRSFTLNNPMIALVALPLIAALVAFLTRKKRASIWFVGLAIASIFAVAGFFAL